ncbi:HobA family DNA replication regulator [Helicobacter fennelliae]|uniref:DnaA initiator-associating factor for replication initiation HobA n=1 Tax=Helicobacter fennelliae TaxID=215 RepID=A0A2X3BC74_9HELI|nr:HobA family DNA replication regulator [Helicobacter fennelliae]SQB99377.1 DnaA initiator-associating factor for replication initiation HobA [Helicobacter fennelliae]STQ84937.1 DnaA initiator-associating factor for replication initiation HobA [Helicobacter fennelliae]
MNTLDFREWLLDSIRQDYKKWTLDRSWLEENRNPWADTAIYAIRHILNGGSLIIATDEKRAWFESYALSKFFQSGQNRPLLPIFSLNKILPPDFVIHKSNIQNIYNMLHIAYNKYMFWYIGQVNNDIAHLCLGQDFTLVWSFDEGIKNSFYLRSNDPFLDIKLIEMLDLFEKAIYAVILEQVVLE